MTRTKFSPAAAVAAGLLFTLVGCEAKKSETPLSPSVAGPIPGVEISTPRLIEPSMGAKLKDAQQPIRLMIENSNTSGVRPLAYTFEVATASSWLPRSGYYRVQVSNGQVVAARDSSGQAVADFGITVDGIWDELLEHRARGELNSARFDERGVPVEVDMGPWAVDGGVHYSVRNFAASR